MEYCSRKFDGRVGNYFHLDVISQPNQPIMGHWPAVSSASRYWQVHKHLQRTEDDGLVVYGRQLVIPAALRQQMLQSLHFLHAESYLTGIGMLFLLNLVQTILMEGFSRTETMLSRACCVDPILYPPKSDHTCSMTEF